MKKKQEPIALERLCEIFDEDSRSVWRQNTDLIEEDTPLIDYGFDSLYIVEPWVLVENEIGREIDIDLDVTKTCRELHRMICEAVE